MSKGVERAPRPEVLEPRTDTIPPALKDRDQWLVWRQEWIADRDEWTKVPVDPNTGRRGNTTDMDTWGAFDIARTYYENPGTDVAGLGFVFAPEDDVMGIDLDKCRDAETGQPEQWAVDVVTRVDSFTEVSPSGTGFHIYALGDVPEGGNRKGDLEMYDEARFFTVTGHHVDTTPLTVDARQDAIDAIHAEHIADDEPEAPEPPARKGGGDLDDETVLEKARASKNADKFEALWRGDTSGYPSHSEADAALCSMLAFWTQGDAAQIDRLFRRSGLMRQKWKRDDYRERTIQGAIRTCSEFYTPSRARNRSRPAPPAGGDPGPVHELFIRGCEAYDLDPNRVDTISRDGEIIGVPVEKLLLGLDGKPLEVADAIFQFAEHADELSGTEKQAVIGEVVLEDLREHGEFFTTPNDRLYYFDDRETQVYRVGADGRREFSDEFAGLLKERYNLLSGRFSRNLGKDVKTRARRQAPEREVYRFATYDEDAAELYITDFEDGYYAVSPDVLEWRPNGSDVFFLPTKNAEPYTFIPADERPALPDAIPGEIDIWRGNGDALMRLFGNRINFDEYATLSPAEQRKQLYLHLHTLPFVDLVTARPIMAWVGEKGSGKTVIQRSIGRFIYGPEFAESTMPDSRDDFLAKVSNQALAFLDNYDDGEDWANDLFAAIATGAGVDMREYYTTNELYQTVPRCWLSVTSRDLPDRRDDVIDRTLVFRVARLEDNVVGMHDYLRQVGAYRDVLWSVYLENLQRVLAAYRETDTGSLSSSHRMADWAILARIAGDALEVGDVGELLDVMQTERAAFALENEPWARVLGRWIDAEPSDAGEFQTASSLADSLSDYADANNLPISVTSAQGIGSKLSHYHTELGELYGLEIDDSGRSNTYRFDSALEGRDTGLGRFK